MFIGGEPLLTRSIDYFLFQRIRKRKDHWQSLSWNQNPKHRAPSKSLIIVNVNTSVTRHLNLCPIFYAYNLIWICHNGTQFYVQTNFRPPSGLDSRATITIGEQHFEVEATDLESLQTLGRGAYGVVEKVRHRPSDTIMAVKVSLQRWLRLRECKCTGFDVAIITLVFFFIKVTALFC